MSTMSRHYRLEYCAFNQHWRSILTSLLGRRVLICFVRDTWASKLKKDSFNLRISTSALLLTCSSLFWSNKIIGIRSFLLILCNDSFVRVVMFQPSGWQYKNTGYKVKTKTLQTEHTSTCHTSNNKNCHHQIIYAKLNLKIYYLPPYEQKIWHYQKANRENNRKAIDQFSWAMRFTNIDVNEKIMRILFTTKLIMNPFIKKWSQYNIKLH